VTTPAITGSFEVDFPNGNEDDFISDLEKQVFPEDYKPEFYYEHEKEFNKIADDFKAPVKVFFVAKKGETVSNEEVNFTLTKENVVFPTSEELNPGKVYDGTKFMYQVPVTLTVDSLKAENLLGSDGKAIDAELAEKVMEKLKGTKLTVNMPVMIGLLGDFDLSHSVVQTDATFILREQLSTQVENKSIIEDVVLADRAEAKAELGEYMVDFAKFLGDTDMDGEGKQVDATFILRAILARDVSGATDKKRISEEIWKEVGVFK
jgi:hypothetical protein